MSQMIERILVGVDGSDNSRRALEWAATLANGLGAEVVAVHAAGLLTHIGEGAAVPSHSHREELRNTLETVWCEPLRERGVPYRSVLMEGPPVLALLEAASEHEVAMIIVGRRGVGGFAELMLGSTSHQVAEHSTCPVLIIPPVR